MNNISKKNRNYFMPRFLKQQFLFITLCVCCSLLSYGQSLDSTAQKQSSPGGMEILQYVKLEIGMHILDCPVLPPNLKNKLMTLKGIKDYTIDKKTESILFNIPEGVITREGLAAMVAGSGFPPKSVNIIIENKPFVN